MTTLLTHNAVVSILMENFQKNLNNKENESLHLKLSYIEVRKFPFSYRHPEQSFQFLTWRKFWITG